MVQLKPVHSLKRKACLHVLERLTNFEKRFIKSLDGAKSLSQHQLMKLNEIYRERVKGEFWPTVVPSWDEVHEFDR